MDAIPLAPVVCSLSAGGFQQRAQEIAALRQNSLKSVVRTDLVLELRYEPAAIERVRAMVTAERACCAFLDFQVEETSADVLVRISAPDRARAVADDLFVVFGGEDARGNRP